MSSKRQKLIQLLEYGEFKEARRYIRTLRHPKQDELLRRVNIAEEKYLQHSITQSRRENLEII